MKNKETQKHLKQFVLSPSLVPSGERDPRSSVFTDVHRGTCRREAPGFGGKCTSDAPVTSRTRDTLRAKVGRR